MSDTPANTSQKARRDPTIDGLKLVAAAAIVMVHVSMQPAASALPRFFEQVSYSALYFFFLVAGYFHGARGTRGAAWLRQRFVRLAVPYYVWSLVFVAWWNLYHIAKGWDLWFPEWWKFLFFAGAAEVLWSLPWLFACALAAEMFARTDAGRRALLVVMAVLQLAIWAFLPQSMIPNFAIRQFINGARWIFIYAAGMEIRAADRPLGTPTFWTAGGLVALVSAGLLATITGAQPTGFWQQIAMFLLNGTVAVSLLAGARVNAKWFGARHLAWGGDYLLGVYCSHGLWLAILIRFVSADSMPVPVWLVFGWVVCFGAALLVTNGLLSTRWTRLAVT
jgi:hypothetical protein